MSENPAIAFEEIIDGLLHMSAAQLVRDADPAAFLDWISRLAPLLGRGLVSAPVASATDAAELVRMMRLLGHTIYAAMPLPQHRFVPHPLPLPGRNDPCLCGSQRKFKQCCAPLMSALPRLEPATQLPHVLDAMGKQAWRSLPQQDIPLAWIEAVASEFFETGRTKDAVALLEPWAAQPGRYPAAWAGLLDLLGDLLADLGKPRKRKTLALQMIERGEPAVQSKGWQRLALMACDAGKRDEAMTAFANAQRLQPDDPALSLLELSLLIGFGEQARAAERAEFHIRRLSRSNGDGRHNELIAALRQLGETGPAYMEAAELRRYPELALLDAWAAGLPAPELRLDLSRCTADNLGELRPLRSLAAALKEWSSLFDMEAPSLVALQSEAGDAWQDVEGWMNLLEREPALGDSFDVLDGLLLALEVHRSPGAQAVGRRLLERGLALWSLLRERFPAARCEWAVWPNRPALRLLALHIVSDPSPTAERSFDWLRHLVEVLNPNDNHGFRWRLGPVLLRRGMVAEALALCERYPEDSDALALVRVLALWHTGQRGAATTLLHDTLRANPKLAQVMRSPTQPAPRQRDYVSVGSLHEAQLVYADQFDLWQTPELRELLSAASSKRRR
ncbi:MAG TPA: SEC-C domain-containing protein [Albitalea sp.]|nr:SEC-C domain-containing protein [Albitalea sp.]